MPFLLVTMFACPAFALSLVKADSISSEMTIIEKKSEVDSELSSTKKPGFFEKIKLLVDKKRGADSFTEEVVRKANSNAAKAIF